MNEKKDAAENSVASLGSSITGYTVVRKFTRQGLRRSDKTPEWREAMKKKFEDMQGPFPVASPEPVDWNDIVRNSGLVISILRDEETGIEEVTETYRYDVDTSNKSRTATTND